MNTAQPENNAPACVLVVGAGLLGSALATAFYDLELDVHLASRNVVEHEATWHSFDGTSSESWSNIIEAVQPDSVVLVHGPSDVNSCERNPAAAIEAHRRAAELANEYAPDAWKLLISTDNVFAGNAPTCHEDDVVEPCNAYGAAKHAAEEVAMNDDKWLVLRVSVVYGWEVDRPNRTPNFFLKAVKTLGNGKEFIAPVDHWNTPVLLDDFVAVCSEAMRRRATGVLHVGGPQRLSRAEWAVLIAEELETDTSLVVAVPKNETTYASRPANGGLATRRAAEFDSLKQLRTVREGTRSLLEAFSLTSAVDVRSQRLVAQREKAR